MMLDDEMVHMCVHEVASPCFTSHRNIQWYSIVDKQNSCANACIRFLVIYTELKRRTSEQSNANDVEYYKRGKRKRETKRVYFVSCICITVLCMSLHTWILHDVRCAHFWTLVENYTLATGSRSILRLRFEHYLNIQWKKDFARAHTVRDRAFVWDMDWAKPDLLLERKR